MDVAFSRDTPRKVYVQHRLLEQSRDLVDWLDNGAYLYVNRVPGQPLPPRDKEFVRFVLSREGQQIVADSRIFIPLNADQLQAELKKLD